MPALVEDVAMNWDEEALALGQATADGRSRIVRNEELAAALRRAAGEWLPIETAPKDGTRLVVGEFNDDGVNAQDAHWTFWVDYWRAYLPPYGAGFGQSAKPSVYRPLLAPPEPDHD
jgi:hypothetical protein